MSYIYIHIPFCDSICSYCDFCKIYANEKLIDEYLEELEKEIKNNYKNELVKTIYIGGGTPSCLNILQIKKLMNITKLFKQEKEIEFTFEVNPQNVNEEKLLLIKENGVNRLSIGIQSFNKKILDLLERKHTKKEAITAVNLAKKIGFDISIDLIYGLNEETKSILKKDLNNLIKLDIDHVATYSLIIEEHTKLFINNYQCNDDKDSSFYKYIRDTLEVNGFQQYETSNFAKNNKKSIHNLNYWNNGNYYGFGLGAHGFINNVRYENTKSLKAYLKGQYLKEEQLLTIKEDMDNEIMLGLRKIEGIDEIKFKNKFHKSLNNEYPIDQLIKENLLIRKNNFIFIPKEYTYLANEILLKILY